MKNNRIYRKSNILFSFLYILAILAATIYGICNGIHAAQGYVFWFRAVFCLLIGVYLFGKAILEKDIYNGDLESNMIVVLRFIGYLLFLGSAFVYGCEAVSIDSNKIGSISGIIATMVVLNVDSNFLKKERMGKKNERKDNCVTKG